MIILLILNLKLCVSIKEPIHQQGHSFANVENCQIEKDAPAKLNAILNCHFKLA